MKIEKLGICGIISFLSYTAMVLFSPLAYPGYNWLSMAVSDLTAEGAPSLKLATQLNSLFGPCALVSIMAVFIVTSNYKSTVFKMGIWFFTAMEWISEVGYTMFPWINGASNTHPQNIGHIIVTVLVVVFSLLSLILVAIGANKEKLKSLSLWAIVCLIAMLAGPIGTAFFPKSVFGLFERLSTFSAVVFNMILGIYLLKGKFDK